MSSLRNKVDTQSEMMSVYFFIANTNKVDSNKMMHMSFRTFKIKVLIFIIIYLLSIIEWRMTLTLNVPNKII